MQEAVHFKKLHATSTASYGCMNFYRNRLKYCCGMWWLRKEFLVWHVPMPNVSLTYHSIHVRQRESMRWHFAQFLIPLPTWCNRQTVYNYIILWMSMVLQSPFLQHLWPCLHHCPFPFFCQQLFQSLELSTHVRPQAKMKTMTELCKVLWLWGIL